MNETMLTTLYCIIDDFINTLADTAEGRRMLDSWRAKRGPQRRLSLSEVLTLNVLRFYFHVLDLKAFARLAECAYKPYFPGLPSYENFLKATNRSFPFTVMLVRYFLLLNRRRSIFSGFDRVKRVCQRKHIHAPGNEGVCFPRKNKQRLVLRFQAARGLRCVG